MNADDRYQLRKEEENDAASERPLPCPHCSSPKVRVQRKRGIAGTACRSNYYREYVECQRCGARSKEFKRPNSGVRAWNRRASIASTSARAASPTERTMDKIELDPTALGAARQAHRQEFHKNRHTSWAEAFDAAVVEAIRAYLASIASTSEPVAVKRWKHIKRGTTYSEMGRGIFQVDGDLDGEKVIVYRADADGQIWVRPVYEFHPSRFVALEPLTTPPAAPTASEPVAVKAWCQPMRDGEHTPRQFAVIYEDADQGMCTFDDEAEARDHWERANTNWNCYLFGALPLIAEAAAPTATDVAIEALNDDEIMELIKECFPWKTEAAMNNLLTYEKSPPLFPQATYDVPSYRATKFVRAVEARILASLKAARRLHNG